MEGAGSTIVYMEEEDKDVQETKRLVEEKGGKLGLIRADLRSAERCKSVVEEAVKGMGGVDILVLNDGYQMMKETIGELSEEQWVKTFDTNIRPFLYLSKYALSHMSPGSTIITCASVNPYIGRPDLLDDTSTQRRHRSLHPRSLQPAALQRHPRQQCMSRPDLDTPLIPATMNEKAQKEFTSPVGRPGQPSEMAKCFVFLASADSRFYEWAELDS
ncbi:hypothetical protein ONS96_012504 [Cadophora gregata f. sp. sojae]|nr:hypothetical protein ONS96_012504 [Cadophora gregata f. sp. sojae]